MVFVDRKQSDDHNPRRTSDFSFMSIVACCRIAESAQAKMIDFNIPLPPRPIGEAKGETVPIVC
jgi:hypothetical protein